MDVFDTAKETGRNVVTSALFLVFQMTRAVDTGLEKTRAFYIFFGFSPFCFYV